MIRLKYILGSKFPQHMYFMQLKLFTRFVQMSHSGQWNKYTISKEIIGSGAKQGHRDQIPRTIYRKLEYYASSRVQTLLPWLK